jgi:rRNA maturation protein Rpf1
MKVTLLNTGVLTNFGSYAYSPINLDEAKNLVTKNAFQSAIGHQSTAEVLTELLGVKVVANRLEFFQTVTDVALIFKLRSRPPEGKILSREEIEEIGYDFGILRRLK